jgi:hypothetical protein
LPNLPFPLCQPTPTPFSHFPLSKTHPSPPPFPSSTLTLTNTPPSPALPSRHKLVAARQSGDFRHAKSTPQRFQSLRTPSSSSSNNTNANTSSEPIKPDLSRYQPKPKARVRKSTSQRNLRERFAGMDMNDVAAQMGAAGEAGVKEGKYPERPEDVGEGLVKGGFVTHEEFIYELEGSLG